MSSGLIISALAIISALTTLTVEAIKKILDEMHKEYSSNLLAIVVSIVLTVAISAGYMIYWGIPVTPRDIIVIIALIFLTFLSSTCGYDKVVQLIKQIWG